MGKLNKLYDRLFNSPRNYDEISFKKTKNKLFQIIFLAIVGWIIFFVVLVKDASNPQTFISNELQDTVECPEIKIKTFGKTDFDVFSINSLNVTQDFNILDYPEYQYCLGGTVNGLCYNTHLPANQDLDYYVLNKTIVIQRFNLTFQENYLNINFQSKINNTKDVVVFDLWFGDYGFSFLGPIKLQILLKRETIIDSDGNQQNSFVPNIITSILETNICFDYITNEPIMDCSSNTISVFYQTNIVNFYTEETTGQLWIRILKDTFSIGKLILVLSSLVLSFYARKFVFKKRTSWFENNIRDATLHHFNYHILEPKTTERKKNKRAVETSKATATNLQESLLTSKEKKESSSYHHHDETMGSENKYKRLLESIPLQDSYSKGLSLLSKIQLLTMVLILLGIAIFIASKDFKSRLITTQYNDLDEIDLPPFNFSYIQVNPMVNYVWLVWDETLPNKDSKSCDYVVDENELKIVSVCNYTTTNYPNDTCNPTKMGSAVFNGNIKLKSGQEYRLDVTTMYAYSKPFISKDLIYIKFFLNDISYYLKPFSNISIELTKTVFHQSDGTNITTYEPSINVFPLPIIADYSHISNFSVVSGMTNLNIFYSTNIVRDIYIENWFQVLIRTATNIASFISPVQTVVTLFFTKILVKFIYKYSTAHVEFNIREAILFNLYNYKKYKPIFKKNKNVSKNIDETLSKGYRNSSNSYSLN